MLHWLRNIVPKRLQLLSRLCLLVSSLHLALLALLFISFKSQQQYALEIAKQLHINADAKIMFMPLYKSTQSLSYNKGGGSTGIGTIGTPRSATAKRPRIKERAPTSLVSDNTALRLKKERIARAAKAKAEKKKKAQKEADRRKKDAEKKEAAKKVSDAIEKKEEIKKEPEPAIEKKIEPEKIIEPVQEAVAVSGDSTSALSANATAFAAADAQPGQDIVYIGQQEYDALGMQTYLQQELSEHWQPPHGMPADTVCEIGFVVDWQGKATNVTVSKSSGALVYDISARGALLAMEFPDWARGKSFKIAFKQ